MKTIIYSITQISNQVNTVLNHNFSNIWIKGQISSFKIYPSGHAYFTLKDSSSQIDCVFFNYTNSDNIFDSTNIEVTAYGDVSIYKDKGKFQFIVSNLIRSGESELWFKYIELKNKLTREGLFDDIHKRSIPEFPENIAIITSNSGSVIKDILTILKRRANYLNIDIYDVLIQGEQSSKEIKQAICNINDLKDVDLIIIARGGGSIEDFQPFNEEITVRAIYSSNIPIITALGHRTDVTLSDYVADKFVGTPSEAAEICCHSKVILMEKASNLIFQIDENVFKIIKNLTSKYENLHLRSISKNPKLYLSNIDSKLDHLVFKLNESIFNKLFKHNLKLNNLYNVMSASNVTNIKRKGFALVRDVKENIIKSIKTVDTDDVITIELTDGKIESTIKRKIDG